ncbi:MAG: alkaline phosphatase family protein [Planctomycetota bacterium]|nr:MAG: alkaline phosphatase family protein [Planctomycetota bacterium]
MKKKLLVINAVGLTKSLIESHSVFLKEICSSNTLSYLTPPIPAVTCTSQSNMLTGKDPSEHGIVANGWYFRDLSQILLWRQSNHLVQCPKIWDVIKERHPEFTTAKMFWWYNMYANTEYSVTPRPIYRSDGSKQPNSYAHPPDLNDSIKSELGPFPLFHFWGPMTSIKSTQWIADATIKIMREKNPNLCLTYLPHLDYNLQRIGSKHPDIKKDVEELDQIIKQLYSAANDNNYETIIVSEYGIQEVNTPIHINRILRQEGFITPTIELGEEHPDPGASKAFAMADHQIAHIYIKNKKDIQPIKLLLDKHPHIDNVLDQDEQKDLHLNHSRSGELIALAKKNAWFTYYYWLDDNKAPDFARTVDIHKKPGYDPVELFMTKNGKQKAAWTILKKKLGFRYLLDIIPLDANLVKGSHGVLTSQKEDGPLLISNNQFNSNASLNMKDIFHLIDSYFA